MTSAKSLKFPDAHSSLFLPNNLCQPFDNSIIYVILVNYRKAKNSADHTGTYKVPTSKMGSSQVISSVKTQDSMQLRLKPGKMASPQVDTDGRGDFVARITLGSGPLQNPERGRQMRIATTIGDHPMVYLFDKEDIRGEFHRIFSTADWSYIVPCRVGYSLQEPAHSTPTILVGVRPNTTTIDEAVGMLNLAAKSVYRFSSLHDVAIEIVEADIMPYASQSSPRTLTLEHATDGYEFEEAFCDEPRIGVPLSRSDSTATGTLGGYLRVSTASGVKYMAMTCHHVVTSKSPSDPLTVTPTNPV